MLDARFAVRDGLKQLLDADADAWPGPTPLVFRGRLLDYVGSDARPLVVLLATVAEKGVVAQLRAARAAGTPFAQARGPLVVSLTDEHFLRRDFAQWAVETWAFALGYATLDALTPGVARPVPPPPPPTPRAVPASAPAASSAAGATTRGARPTVAGGRPMPGANPLARPYIPPNAPAGYRPPRPNIGPLGTRPPAGALPARVVRGAVIGVGVFCAVAIAIFVVAGPRRGIGTMAADPVVAAGELADGVASVASGTSGTSAATSTAPSSATAPVTSSAPLSAQLPERASSPPRPTVSPNLAASGAPSTARIPRPDAAAMGVPVMPQALPGVTAGALPASTADSSRLVFVRPPMRASTAPSPPAVATPPRVGAAPSAGGAGAGVRATTPAERPGLGLRNVGTGTLDRVVKRNGDVLAGRVEVVRASEIQFLEAESRLRYAIPKREIREIITEFGTRVRFDADVGAAPSVVPMGPLVRKGVGGTYDVAYRVARVEGSPECRGLWRTPPADDELIIVHVPGADTLSIRADNGGTFSAVIDPGANFATSLLPQTEASVGSSAITSRMSGRFTAEGFVGDVNIIGYRRQPTGRDISCYSTLTAYGRKRRG